MFTIFKYNTIGVQEIFIKKEQVQNIRYKKNVCICYEKFCILFQALLKKAATVESGGAKMKCLFALEYTSEGVDREKSEIVCEPKIKKPITVKKFVIKSKEPLCLFMLDLQIRNGKGNLKTANIKCLEPTISSLSLVGSAEKGKTKLQCIFALEYAQETVDLQKSKVFCVPKLRKPFKVLTTSKDPFCLFQLKIRNTKGNQTIASASRECIDAEKSSKTFLFIF